MKHIVAKMMISLAVGIILMHVLVPHRHSHNCGDGGLVFETELACEECHSLTSEHHHHDDDSPLSHCRLQDQLTKLVISHRVFDTNRAFQYLPECDIFVLGDNGAVNNLLSVYDMGCVWLPVLTTTPLQASAVYGYTPLRAPPTC